VTARRVVLAAILLACLVGRTAFVLDLAASGVEADTHSYVRPARALVEDGRYDHRPGHDEPEYLRTPGYPGVIAAVFAVSDESTTAVLLLQVGLSTLTVLLVYLLAARMWSTTVGLVAAALTVLEPLQSYTAGSLATECVNTLLLLLVCAAGFAALRDTRSHLRWFVLLGLALAAATMVRPVTYYLPAFVVVLLLVRAARGAVSWSRCARMLAAFLVPLVVIVGGWQVRNYERAGSWRLSGVEGKNLMYFRAAGILAERDGITLAAAQARLGYRPIPPNTPEPGAYYDRMYRRGLEVVLAHPVTALRLTGEDLANELTSVRYDAFEYFGLAPATGVVAASALALLLAFEALAIYGFVLAVRSRREVLAHVFVAGVAIYVLVASAGPEAMGARGERFRAPVVPILVLYAAYGATSLVRGLARSPATPDLRIGT
jgi:4-amino-4-deoxy-L-arabinose transferase-like glycosyltransferase